MGARSLPDAGPALREARRVNTDRDYADKAWLRADAFQLIHPATALDLFVGGVIVGFILALALPR